MQPDETDEERLEKLPEDNERPFSPAEDDAASPRDSTYPTTDTDVDSTESYQEGVDNPNDEADQGIAGYDPEKDQRRQH